MRGFFGDLVLRPWFLGLIAVLPLLAFGASSLVLHQSALDFGWLPQHFAQFNAGKAEAARLGAFGAFFLFSAAAVGALLYFLNTLRLLRMEHALAILALFVVSSALIQSILVPAATSQTDKFVGSALVCTALGYQADQNGPDKTKAWDKIEENKVPKFKIPETLRKSRPCAETTLAKLNWLLGWNELGVLIGLNSLVFGSILCLAGPAKQATWITSEELAHWEDQSERLNAYLYLSALLLVTGLMFISAVFRWPAHALLADDATSYEAHAGALVTYYGFSYSVVIAAFYIPVAMVLSARVQRLKPATATASGIPAAFKGPMQLLKIAAAIFSTTLAGILSSLVAFG